MGKYYLVKSGGNMCLARVSLIVVKILLYYFPACFILIIMLLFKLEAKRYCLATFRFLRNLHMKN